MSPPGVFTRRRHRPQQVEPGPAVQMSSWLTSPCQKDAIFFFLVLVFKPPTPSYASSRISLSLEHSKKDGLMPAETEPQQVNGKARGMQRMQSLIYYQILLLQATRAHASGVTCAWNPTPARAAPWCLQ